jgi:aryl-alcohol dehydrogenase-like predicted oxidoreductase
MRLRRLGSRGPEISAVGLGAWEAGGGEYGAGPPEAEIIEAYHAGFDAGINWIDTAEVYGPHTSEELVGRAVAGRDGVMDFSKVGPRPLGSGYEPDAIRAAAEGSLQRIGRDSIDLYQLHQPVPGLDIEAAWEAMAGLVEDGLVRHIGLSNVDREQLELCQRIRPVDSLQPNLSLLYRPLQELIAWCGEQGIGVIAYGPLAFGLLTGAVTTDTRFPADDWRSGNTDVPAVQHLYSALFAPDVFAGNLAKSEAIGPVAERLGLTRAQLALAWALAQPGVSGVICGTRSAKRARENAGAGSVELAPADLEEIEALLSRE